MARRAVAEGREWVKFAGALVMGVGIYVILKFELAFYLELLLVGAWAMLVALVGKRIESPPGR